jgi:hypothetical protein
MTLKLAEDLESRLKERAARLGLEPDAYASKLIEQGLAAPHPNQATLDLLAKWDEEEATDDPEEIARRNREFEEFKESLNRSRLEMEGPNARKPFP